ncbi:HNH endonuclease [Palleronia caenipelagi]|uniref:HNH endonuclease n=1 Tax=Palleronia caenipelagi TaxID=2489174 RepID=A0A547Q993_9RHOB|nr:HNH endonuclease signature motif containing protein [Palleronia caenipelagi]TRD22955.1 HNH endonuclease [Palleronia caenipelagi]
MTFTVGQGYSRRADIHARFGGQRQGGISTPKDWPYIFIFTGKSGEAHGYQDGWRDDELFLYTGEGQSGDMTFKGGNKAIRDHVDNGKELLLFESLGKSQPVRFMGSFICQSWDTFDGPDSSGVMRECIQFHLVRLKAELSSTGPDISENGQIADLTELRRRALKAAVPSQTKDWRNAPQAYRRRSQAVKDYVLARANGRCELTGKPAPFETKAGLPYLEVHHTRRLSDDGPDDPRFVAAICPTVHREIHFGAEGTRLNEMLIEKLGQLESAFDGAV